MEYPPKAIQVIVMELEKLKGKKLLGYQRVPRGVSCSDESDEVILTFEDEYEVSIYYTNGKVFVEG